MWKEQNEKKICQAACVRRIVCVVSVCEILVSWEKFGLQNSPGV